MNDMKNKTKDNVSSKLTKIENRLNILEKFVAQMGAPYDGKDELFNKAVKMIKKYDTVSASLLQRKLMIGYARAARLLDQLGTDGYVERHKAANPSEVFQRSKPRKVLKK